MVQGEGTQYFLSNNYKGIRPFEIILNGKEKIENPWDIGEDRNNITLKFNRQIEYCKYMFENLENIIEIDKDMQNAVVDNLEAENERARTEQSFMVPKDEIVQNGYDLSINKYKEIIYEQEDLPSSEELIKEISELNDEYQKELAVLKSMLSGKEA